MVFDLREVRRALILAACGTAVVTGLFALFLQAHSPSDQAVRGARTAVRALPTQLVAGAARRPHPIREVENGGN